MKKVELVLWIMMAVALFIQIIVAIFVWKQLITALLIGFMLVGISKVITNKNQTKWK